MLLLMLLLLLLLDFGNYCYLLLLPCYPKANDRARPSLVFGFGPYMVEL